MLLRWRYAARYSINRSPRLYRESRGGRRERESPEGEIWHKGSRAFQKVFQRPPRSNPRWEQSIEGPLTVWNMSYLSHLVCRDSIPTLGKQVHREDSYESFRQITILLVSVSSIVRMRWNKFPFFHDCQSKDFSAIDIRDWGNKKEEVTKVNKPLSFPRSPPSNDPPFTSQPFSHPHFSLK